MFVIQSYYLEDIILRAVCIVSAGLMNTPVITIHGRSICPRKIGQDLSVLDPFLPLKKVTQPPLLVMLSTSLVAEA